VCRFKKGTKMKSYKKVLALVLLVFIPTLVFPDQNNIIETSKPFGHKVFYSENAEQSKKWAVGVRFNLAMPLQFPLPIPTTDVFININDWFDIDIVRSGWKELNIDSNIILTDLFWTTGIRSRPYKTTLFNKPLNLAGGIKLYKSNFELVNKEERDTMDINDNSFILYLTQTMALTEKHKVNLFSSLSLRKGSGGAYYFIPSYTYNLNNKWAFNFEYYATNSLRLPHKTLQFMLDEDKLDFYNSERSMISFMLYGFSYCRKHLRIDITIGNHISFKAPHIIMTGIGWQF
jgi:hypothetical protein